MSTIAAKTQTRGGLFYIKDSISTVVSSSNEFKRNYVANKGGAFSLYNCKMTEHDSTYENLAALYGGAFYCNHCSFTFTQTVFRNLRAYEGGTFYVETYD